MSFRRMLPFLLINILVSAAIMLGILWWWDGREPEIEPVTADLPQEMPEEVPPPGRGLLHRGLTWGAGGRGRERRD